MAEQRVSVIPLGDLLKTISFTLFKELEVTLYNMRNMDPETRTLQLRAFVARSHKILCQLLALTRWLGMSKVGRLFSSITDIENQLNAIDMHLRESQDTLYFVHASLYNKRSRKLEVTIAKDIFARGTYSQLPAAIMNGGMAAAPELVSTTQLLDDLNIAIRAKLLLHEILPMDIESIVAASPQDFAVENGLLLLKYHKLYEVALSLACTHERACWTVLSVKLLVDNDPSEQFLGYYDQRAAEFELLEIIRTQMSASKELVHSTTSADSSDSHNNHVNGIAEKSPRDMNLAAVHALCLHVSSAVALRLMFAQSRDLALGIWKGFIDPDFRGGLPTDTVTYLSVKFWRAQVSKEYQFELRVVHRRTATTSSRQVLRCELHGGPGFAADLKAQQTTETASQDPSSLVSAAPVTPAQCAGFEDVLIAQQYVIDGVHFSRLWNDTVAYCASVKLRLLHRRLLATTAIKEAAQQGLAINHSEDTIKLTWGQSTISLAVDCRSGQFTAIAYNVNDVSLQMSKSCETFMAEINDLEMELLCQEALMDQQYRKPPMGLLSTTPLLCALYTACWGAALKSMTPMTNREQLVAPMKQLLSSSQVHLHNEAVCGLVYNVRNFCSFDPSSALVGEQGIISHMHPQFYEINKSSMSLVPPVEMDSNIGDRAQPSRNGILRPIPDINVYLVLTISADLRVNISGLICRRLRVDQPMGRPSLYRHMVFSSGQLIVSPDSSAMEIVGDTDYAGSIAPLIQKRLEEMLPNFDAWYRKMLTENSVNMVELGFVKERREIYRPAGNRVPVAGTPNGGRSLAVFCSHGRRLTIEFFFIRSQLASSDILDRVAALPGGKELSDDEYALIKSCTVYLGSTAVSAHKLPKRQSPASGGGDVDYVLHVEEFVYDASLTDAISHAKIVTSSYCFAALELLQLSLQPIEDDSDEDEGEVSPPSTARGIQVVKGLYDQLLEGISKISPMLCLLWMSSLYRGDANEVKASCIQLQNLYPMTVATAPLPRALFAVYARESDFGTSADSQSVGSKRRPTTLYHTIGFVEIAMEFMFGRGTGMTLVPSSKFTVKDLTAGVSTGLYFANIDTDDLMNSEDVGRSFLDWSKSVAEKMLER